MAISGVPFTDSHALNPVDSGGELAIPNRMRPLPAEPEARH
jgi:hypothetical protein